MIFRFFLEISKKLLSEFPRKLFHGCRISDSAKRISRYAHSSRRVREEQGNRRIRRKRRIVRKGFHHRRRIEGELRREVSSSASKMDRLRRIEDELRGEVSSSASQMDRLLLQSTTKTQTKKNEEGKRNCTGEERTSDPVLRAGRDPRRRRG